MNLSTNPAVWRTAVGSIVAALVAAGVLGPELGDTVNSVAGALAIAAAAILPVIGAIISKNHTVPVVAGTEPVRTLVRGADGVYAPASPGLANQSGSSAADTLGGDL